MKKTYQINQERALQRFNAAAQKSKQEIQFRFAVAGSSGFNQPGLEASGFGSATGG